jgi:hypothetical protein
VIEVRTWTGGLASLAAVAAAVCFVGPAHGAPASKLIECQRPATTGEEIYGLKQVTATVACPVVRALGHWEYAPGHVVQHIKQLYRCAGAGKHSPVLVLKAFEGWHLSLTPSGAFRMSRGTSSFEVTGTDFPLNCS